MSCRCGIERVPTVDLRCVAPALRYPRYVSKASLLAVLLALTGCLDNAGSGPVDHGPLCTAIGCGDAATLTLPYTGDESLLKNGKARLCVNETCGEVTLTDVPTVNGVGYGQSIHVDGLTASVTITRMGSLVVSAGVSDGEQVFTPGDVYTFRYLAENGDAVLEGNWVATNYAVSYPNGEECGPACHSAQLETR